MTEKEKKELQKRAIRSHGESPRVSDSKPEKVDLTDSESIMEIAKSQVKLAVLKFCKEKNLGGGSYDKIITSLYFEMIPGYAQIYNTNVSGYLRMLAEKWDEIDLNI